MLREILFWLIEYRAWIWPIALPAFILLGIGIALGHGVITARQQAKKRRAKMGAPLSRTSDFRDGMEVVLSGRLQCEKEPCERFEDGSPAAASNLLYRRSFERKPDSPWESMANVQADVLTVWVGNTKILISAPACVLLGSTVHFERALKTLPKAVQKRIRRSVEDYKPFLEDLLVELHSLVPGDRVRVRGTLSQAKLADGGGYRSQVTEWRLVPNPEAEGEQPERIEIVYEGLPNIIRSYSNKILKSCFAGVLAFFALFVIGTEIAHTEARARIDSVDYFDPARTPLPADKNELLWPIGLSLLSPFRSHRVASDMLWHLDMRGDLDPELIQIRGRLYQAIGECSSAAAILLNQGFFEQGLALSDRCGSPTLASSAFFKSGDFKRALAHWKKAAPDWAEHHESNWSAQRFGIELFVLAGDFKGGAQAARHLAALIDNRAGSDPAELKKYPIKLSWRMRAERMYALADALDARAGDNNALARLSNTTDKFEYPVQLALHADLLEGEQRLALLERANSIELDAENPRFRWLLLLKAEADPTRFYFPGIQALKRPETFLLNPEQILVSILPALETGLFNTWSADKEPHQQLLQSKADVLFSLSVFEFFMGKRSLLDKSDRIHFIETPVRPERRAQRILHTWTELLERAAPPMTESVAAGIPQDLRAQDLFRVISALRDGHSIHRWLNAEASGQNPFNAILLYKNLIRLFIPGLEHDRANLLHGLRWGGRAYPFECGTYCYAASVAALADMAMQLGDIALSNEMRRRIEPFEKALLQREIALPLAVLNLP